MVSNYIPNRGDVVWLPFDPIKGSEQAGKRPALVLSSIKYNRVSRLIIVCPITTKKKGYMGEVELPPDLPVKGVILTDHIRSVDWRARKAAKRCAVPDSVMLSVWKRVRVLIDPTIS